MYNFNYTRCSSHAKPSFKDATRNATGSHTSRKRSLTATPCASFPTCGAEPVHEIPVPWENRMKSPPWASEIPTNTTRDRINGVYEYNNICF